MAKTKNTTKNSKSKLDKKYGVEGKLTQEDILTLERIIKYEDKEGEGEGIPATKIRTCVQDDLNDVEFVEQGGCCNSCLIATKEGRAYIEELNKLLK